MDIQELQHLYSEHKQVKALGKVLQDDKVHTLHLSGMCASSAPLVFASLAYAAPQALNRPYLFVLDDAEEAGYFYHDLTQVLGDKNVLFFPSSFRRALKFGQRDAANEILRTEALSRITGGDLPLFLVSYPDALAEKVVSQKQLSEHTLQITVGEEVDISFVESTLFEYGFQRVDYVYEPGQYAVRGSLIDVYSYSSEYPFRIDFFGDEVDSIRTFEVETQLSKDKHERITIVPQLKQGLQENIPFTSFLPDNTVLVLKDLLYVTESVEKIFKEGFARQAMVEQEAISEMHEQELFTQIKKDFLLTNGNQFLGDVSGMKRVEFGHRPTGSPQATIAFNLTAQPIFHKNFEMVFSSFTDYISKGYTLYILADSSKQATRLEAIFDEQGTGIHFTPVSKTLHAGFADDDAKVCFYFYTCKHFHDFL